MIDNDFVESCMKAADGSSEVGIIRTGVRLIDSQGNVIGERPNRAVGLPTGTFFRHWFSAKTAIFLCSTLFNRQRLKDTGGFKSKHNCYDDTMAVFRLAANYGRVDVPEIKAAFRMHEQQKGPAEKISDWCEDSVALLNLMCELAPESKNDLLREGLRFFSRANYRRVRRSSNSPVQRFIATFHVLRHFKFRQLPSRNHFLVILSGSSLYDMLRHVKRNCKCVFSRA
jgi:hypothetical protein